MTPITLETYPGSRKKGLINLIECGYNTLEMVSETDDDVLLRYRNVGPILIADLRKMAMDHGIQITGKPTKPSYKRLERENAALRADNAATHALVLYLRSKEYAERTLAVKLEKENAALRADKERYEWLKDGCGSAWAYKYLRNNFRINDDALDAARKEVKP